MKFEEIQDALAKGKTCYRDSDLNMANGLFGNEFVQFDDFLKISGITKFSFVNESCKLADDWVIFEGIE